MDIDEEIKSVAATADTSTTTTTTETATKAVKTEVVRLPRHREVTGDDSGLTTKAVFIGLGLVLVLILGYWYSQSRHNTAKPANEEVSETDQSTATTTSTTTSTTNNDNTCANAPEGKERWNCQQIVALTNQGNATLVELKKTKSDLQRTTVLMWIIFALVAGFAGVWVYTAYASKKARSIDDKHDDKEDEDDEDEGSKPAST